MLAKLKSRDIFLIALVATLLVFLLWYFVIFQNTRTTISSLQSQLDTLSIQRDAARSAVAQLPALRQQVSELQVKRDELLRELPQTAQVGRVVDEIRTDVLAAGGTLNSVAQNAGAGTGLPAGVTPIGLALGVDGSFESLFRVLRSLEGMSRFSTINSLALNLGGAADSFDPKLSGQMGVTVYTFNPNAAGAGATSGASTAGSPAAPAAAPAAPAPGGTQ